ncbi:hypothetical protein CEXT_245941 [Caerostris extrusa]|uniref:Uncharacterized protein n=1 Tax=Caerostris extrusa TaxID=172846 RepID=A0AAV4NFN2_CAEEX|nr:hypothetical protein CEXT_245941 [Caerostris extrusa]
MDPNTGTNMEMAMAMYREAMASLIIGGSTEKSTTWLTSKDLQSYCEDQRAQELLIKTLLMSSFIPTPIMLSIMMDTTMDTISKSIIIMAITTMACSSVSSSTASSSWSSSWLIS